MRCSPRADNTEERRKMFRSTRLAMKHTALAVALATLAGFVVVRALAIAAARTPAGSRESVRALPLTSRASAPPRYFFATRSTNWAGYGTTSLESLKLFHSISARWIVPRIQSGSPLPSFGAQWIGIGGNCVLAGCLLEDPTLVQTGTLEEVSPSGKHIYQAWYEMLPNPSIPIPNTLLRVRPGDHMLAQLTETVPGIWNLKISNLTNGDSFQTSVLLGSLGLTAEWIEEAPTVQFPGAASIQSLLPHLTRTLFYDLDIDGRPATLSSPERITLMGPRGNVEASTSRPGPNGNSFEVCPYRATCPAP
jgi:hypothetical protein